MKIAIGEVMKWIKLKTQKPKEGQEVLVFDQGHGVEGNYWFHYDVCAYIRSPYDKRKMVFVPHIQKSEPSPWVHRHVTHWMPLPTPPKELKHDR